MVLDKALKKAEKESAKADALAEKLLLQAKKAEEIAKQKEKVAIVKGSCFNIVYSHAADLAEVKQEKLEVISSKVAAAVKKEAAVRVDLQQKINKAKVLAASKKSVAEDARKACLFLSFQF